MYEGEGIYLTYKNISFSDRSLNVTNDWSIWVIQKFNTNLGDITFEREKQQIVSHFAPLK